MRNNLRNRLDALQAQSARRRNRTATVDGRVELDLLDLAEGRQSSAVIDRDFALRTLAILTEAGAFEYGT